MSMAYDPARNAAHLRLAEELQALGVPMPEGGPARHGPSWDAVTNAPSSSFVDGEVTAEGYAAIFEEALRHPRVRPYLRHAPSERVDESGADREAAALFRAGEHDLDAQPIGRPVPKAPTGYERTTGELFADGMNELAPAPSKGGR